MKTIRWGIIGCGDVTEVKSGPGFQKADHSSLVAVMRRNGDLARDYALRHGVPRWYDDAESLVSDPEVDAVYVATPPSSHKECTLLCARAGKPVYVEKPMALNFSECQEMISACKETGTPLFVAYYRRALPRMLKIKELIDSGRLGEIRFLTTLLSQPAPLATSHPAPLPWRVVPAVSGGGLFVDLACHTLDFLDFVLGPITQVKGFAANQAHLHPAEDMVAASFVFASGVHGVGTWCFSSFERRDYTEIVGTEGKIGFATFGTDPIVLTTSLGREEFAYDNPPHIEQPLIQTIVNELNGVGLCPSSGESGARTSWVMDCILKEYVARLA